jgi:hypothetical protein
MKTSLTKLSSSFFLLSLSLTVWGKPVAQVVEVSGAVFMVSPDGKTSALKMNQHLEDRSEVMVEEGASITLNDYYDATYHLTGGSHLKFFDKSVQLKKGKSWIQSMNSRHPLALTTANGNVSFWKGEFITTFDQSTNRSQILVVNGEVEVSNILDQHMKYSVAAGMFSMVDPEVENGVPRTPTKVGLASLEKALSEFKHLPAKIKADPAPSREIASVKEEIKDSPVTKKGEIIFMTAGRIPASVTPGSAHNYYKKIIGKKTAPTAQLSVPIKFYGTSWKKTETVAPRSPASIQVIAPTIPKFTAPSLKNDPEFTDSLKNHTTQQPKYSKELENLINDLRSY